MFNGPCIIVTTKNKNQLDTTYFIVLLIGSTRFGHYYAHHQEHTTIMLIITLVVSFLACCRLEVRYGQAGVVSGLQAALACSPDTTRSGLTSYWCRSNWINLRFFYPEILQPASTTHQSLTQHLFYIYIYIYIYIYTHRVAQKMYKLFTHQYLQNKFKLNFYFRVRV